VPEPDSEQPVHPDIEAAPSSEASGLTPEQEAWLNDVFTYHAPDPADIIAYIAMRESGKSLGRTILLCTPACADQTAAIRSVREAIMSANAARARRGRPAGPPPGRSH